MYLIVIACCHLLSNLVRLSIQNANYNMQNVNSERSKFKNYASNCEHPNFPDLSKAFVALTYFLHILMLWLHNFGLSVFREYLQRLHWNLPRNLSHFSKHRKNANVFYHMNLRPCAFGWKNNKIVIHVAPIHVLLCTTGKD